MLTENDLLIFRTSITIPFRAHHQLFWKYPKPNFECWNTRTNHDERRGATLTKILVNAISIDNPKIHLILRTLALALALALDDLLVMDVVT
jgi:hypothetical protein